MRRVQCLLPLGLLALIAGCGGPKLKLEELGELVHQQNKLPGFAQPYALPKLDSIDRDAGGEHNQMLESLRQKMKSNSTLQPPAPVAPPVAAPVDASPPKGPSESAASGSAEAPAAAEAPANPTVEPPAETP